MAYCAASARWRAARAASLCVCLLGPAGALAQSSLRVFGTIDGGIELVSTGDPGSASMLRVSSGSARSSRLVFDGAEVINPALTAKFQLDIGFWADTGAVFPTGSTPAALFGRRAVLGLSGRDWGALMIGREYRPHSVLLFKADVADLAYYGSMANRARVSGFRVANALAYTSPAVAGFSALALWGAGAVAGDGNNEARAAPFDEGRQRAVALDYTGTRLYAGAAYGTIATKDSPGAGTSSRVSDAVLVAKYQFDGVALNAGASHVHTPGQRKDIATVIVGVQRALSPVCSAGLQLSRSIQDAASGVKPAETVLSLHISYQLSARTMLYANVARQRNNSSSSQPLIGSVAANNIAPATPGTTPRVLLIGMSHNF